MVDKLIDIVEDFIELCEDLYEEGKIDKELYLILTENKFEFLNDFK